MKKTIALFLAMLLVIASTVAFAADYSSMSEAELKAQFEAIRNELAQRGLVAEKNTVLVEQAGIKIYISGETKVDKPYAWSENYNLYIPVIVINDSKSNINMIIENASVNGWSTRGNDDGGSTPAGKKSKVFLVFELEDTDVETLEDFTDVEFVLQIYDTDTYKDLVYTEPITVYAK